jgi:hypothetical protein
MNISVEIFIAPRSNRRLPQSQRLSTTETASPKTGSQRHVRVKFLKSRRLTFAGSIDRMIRIRSSGERRSAKDPSAGRLEMLVQPRNAYFWRNMHCRSLIRSQRHGYSWRNIHGRALSDTSFA